jgi:hypothetical protein
LKAGAFYGVNRKNGSEFSRVCLYKCIPRLFFQTDRREQHFTPGRFTPLLLPEQTPAGAQESPVFEFPRHRLRLLEKLGEGAFGMVSSGQIYCQHWINRLYFKSLNTFIAFSGNQCANSF